MKPVLNPKTLQAALVLVGGMLVLVSQALVDFPDLLHPRWVLLMGSLGGLLGGKEALRRHGDIAVEELPLDFVERKTDPQ